MPPIQVIQMNIVLIIWKIKKDKEKAFLKKWKQMGRFEKAGLFREFLSKVGEELDYKYRTWHLTNPNYITYINVGIWRSMKDFEEAIGQYMNEKNPIYDFEYERRERRILDEVALDREGLFKLPKSKV